MSELRSFAEPILHEHPELIASWKACDNQLCLHKSDPSGFDIHLSTDTHALYLHTEHGYEDHWPHCNVEELQGNLTGAFGLVRDLLSPAMRLRVLRSSGSPMRWLLERQVGRQWQTESTTAVLVWNYFGRRSEAVYINHTLPARSFPEANPPERAA